MNHQPLLRVGPWYNGMRCVSCFVLMSRYRRSDLFYLYNDQMRNLGQRTLPLHIPSQGPDEGHWLMPPILKNSLFFHRPWSQTWYILDEMTSLEIADEFSRRFEECKATGTNHYGNIVVLASAVHILRLGWYRWMSLYLTDGKLILYQLIAWCRQAPSHYLHQCWKSPKSPFVAILI